MKKSIKKTLLGIVGAGSLALGSLFFTGCQNPDVMSVKRTVQDLGNKTYQVKLNIDVDEKKDIETFIVTEYVPYGMEIIEASNGAAYNDEFRSQYNMIEWIGSDINSNIVNPEVFPGLEDSNLLKLMDQTIEYRVKLTEDYGSNSKFSGDWVSDCANTNNIYKGQTK